MGFRFRHYMQFVVIAGVLMYAVLFTSRYLKTHRSSNIKTTTITPSRFPIAAATDVGQGQVSSEQLKASGRYTSEMKVTMFIPDEIINCANKSISTPYIYDFNTDFYLPPPVQDLCRMKLPDLELLYQRYLTSVQTVCKTTRRFGKLTDGGWDVCVEPRYITRNACLVYSFGINYDFSFDDEIANLYNCEVHSFDPSMSSKSHVRSKGRTYFHKSGLSDITRTKSEADEWRLQTFQDIRTELQHLNRMPDVIKMDIEAWEWNVLPDMFATGQFPVQMIIEFHLWNEKLTTQRDMWIRRLSVLRDVYDAGYRIFWMNRNLRCTYKSHYTSKQTLACHEISLIRNGPNVMTSSNI